MKPLPLNEALELYKVLAPYIPKEYSDELDFAGKIIGSIRKSKKYADYAIILTVLTEFAPEDLLESSFDEILLLIVDGLKTHKILELNRFCNSIGFADA